MNKGTVIAEEWREQGIELKESDDHVLELYKGGTLLARFTQTGITLDAIKKEITDYDRKN